MNLSPWKIFFHRYDKNGRVFAGGVLPYVYRHKQSAERKAKSHFANAANVGWCVRQSNPFPSECRECKKDCHDKKLAMFAKYDFKTAERKRLTEWVVFVTRTLQADYAPQTYVLTDEAHGLNIYVEDVGNGAEYVVSACGFDYGSGDVFDLKEWYRISVSDAYNDASIVMEACLNVLNTRFPGWEEL